jgi:hypothetical protein
MAKPIAPPVSISQSCGFAPLVWVKIGSPEVTASSTTIVPSGMCRASASPDRVGLQLAPRPRPA